MNLRTMAGLAGLVLSILLAGCGGDNVVVPGGNNPGNNGSGGNQAIRSLIATGPAGQTLTTTFQSGALPAPGASPAPTISAAGSTPDVVRGGSLILNVTTPAPVDQILVGVSGQPGFYTVNTGAAARSRATGGPTYQLILTVPPTSTLSGFDVSIFTITSGVSSAPGTIHVTVDTVAQTSQHLQVSLSWSAPVDMDLHLETPDGTVIGYDNRIGQNGGTLDRDSNAGCTLDNIDQENITWANNTPPSGNFVVRPDLWSNCGQAGPFPYVITINENGQQQVIQGVFQASEADHGSANSTPASHAIPFTFTGSGGGGTGGGALAASFSGSWTVAGVNEGGGVFAVHSDTAGHVTGTVTQEIGGSATYAVSGSADSSGHISFTTVASGATVISFSGTWTQSGSSATASGTCSLSVVDPISGTTTENGTWQTTPASGRA